MAQESNWRRGRPEQNLAVGEPQTESQGADVRPGFDTLIDPDHFIHSCKPQTTVGNVQSVRGKVLNVEGTNQ